MPRRIEILTKLSAQLMRFLFSRSAENLTIDVNSSKDQISVLIKSTVKLTEKDVELLEGYLKVESHEEMAYYYLPLAGEYGSDEDLMLISMLVNSVQINYDKEKSSLRISFVIRSQ